MKKRYRLPKPKPGELRLAWGKIPNESSAPELCYIWGDGVPAGDKHLLHRYFSVERPRYGSEVDPSFLEALEARGYDLSTISFSIRKKVASETNALPEQTTKTPLPSTEKVRN